MQQKKCNLKLYSNFLLANHNRYSATELERVAPVDLAHDAVTRFLTREDFTPSDLWNEVKPLVCVTSGYLVGDDSLLDKRYSRKNELAKVQYSGNEHDLLNGIAIVNLLWARGRKCVPVDYRVYEKARDDKTKNGHFDEMLDKAEKRGFTPDYVLMDTFYARVTTLKHIAKKGWKWIASLKENRQVSVTKGLYISVSHLDFAKAPVKQVWLKEYGTVLVSKLVTKDGDVTYLATNDLEIPDKQSLKRHWQYRWDIEEFHRGIKQTTGIEQCEARKAAPSRTHIFAAFVAYVKMEKRRWKEKVSWYEQKAEITRPGARAYLLANA
jgi:hypothetical protein